MTLHNPFDFVSMLVIDLAGNPEVFSFLAIFLIAIALAKFNFSNRINLTLFTLAAVLLSSYLGGIYVIAILLIGLSTYYAFSKLQR